jgi:hypothetical protein
MNWELFWFALPRMALLIPMFYICWRVATWHE